MQFGDVSAESQAYFWITCNAVHPVTLNKLELKLAKIGSPTDIFVVDLVLDNAGVPGVALESNATAAPTLPTAHTRTSFQFKTLLMPGTKYGFLFRRSGSLDATNYFRIVSHSAAGYTNGQTKVLNASTWTARSDDLFFRFDAKSVPLIDVGAVNERAYYAQKFTVDAATANYGIVTASFKVLKTSPSTAPLPTDGLLVQILSDNLGNPGTLVGQVTVPATSIKTSLSLLTVSFGLGQVAAVSPGTGLWLVIRRVGAISPLGYYLLEADQSTPPFTISNAFYNATTSLYVAVSPFKWLPYSVAYGVDSIEQIRRIYTAFGQFFSSLDIRVSSGIFVSAYAPCSPPTHMPRQKMPELTRISRLEKNCPNAV